MEKFDYKVLWNKLHGLHEDWFDGDANESRPGPSAPAGVVESAFFVRDVSSDCWSVTTIAVTHTTIVVTASTPAR